MSALRSRSVAVVWALLAASCAPRGSFVSPPSALEATTHGGGLAQIKHVVIVVQEARTLNNLFAGWPSAYAPLFGQSVVPPSPVKLHTMTYAQDESMCELAGCMGIAYGQHDNDGFERNVFCRLGCVKYPDHAKLVSTFPYAYMNHHEIAPYRALARQYVLADNMYATEIGGDFTAHQDLIGGSTFVDAEHFVVDVPTRRPWGCDAPKGTTVPLEHVGGYNGGQIYPCFTQYPTMAELLDDAHLPWKYYVAPASGSDPSGRLWNAFDAIAKVRDGPDWRTNIVSPPGQILSDAANGELPAVSWVIPKLAWSDHPSSTSDEGPSWVAAIVNAVGEGPQWDSTAIVIVWSEWGGWFDARPPYAPHNLRGSGLGFRVPMLVVSPFAKKNRTSHIDYQFGSILRFVEQVFGLPGLSSLGYGFVFSDEHTNSLTGAFDFTQKARKFVPIPAKYPPSTFMH